MSKLTAVLLHGIAGTGRMFGPLMDCLPDWVAPQVINYPTQQVVDYAQLTTYVIDRLPNEQPFFIVAESFAGPLALKVSERQPAGLCAMVLVCTFVTNPRPWLSLLGRPLINDCILSFKPRRWMAKLFVTGFDISEEMLQRAFAIHELVSPTVLRHRLYDVFRVDVRNIYQATRTPVLHLYAKHDHLILKSSTRQLQQLRPDIRSVAVDGPHYLLQTKPQACVEEIVPFIKGVVPPAE